MPEENGLLFKNHLSFCNRYLPPYTSFLPIVDGKCFPIEEKTRSKSKNILDYLLFSQLTYLAMFVILICITEREKIKEDPVNFNLLSIVVEVIRLAPNFLKFHFLVSNFC